MVNKLKKKTVGAFTLVEMLITLLIISVLMLLFVPNLTKQKETITKKGDAAVVKVVESQAELYELNHPDEKASLSKLIQEKQITAEQQKSYRSYYQEHPEKKADELAD